MTNKSIKTKLAKSLRKIGNKKSLEKAQSLEQQSASSNAVHLRDLGLTASDIIAIVSCFKEAGEEETHSIRSISVSYNPLLGDAGVMALVKHLPSTISEIGLVNCSISDLGGLEILDWMRNAPKLQMICMEQNNFSEKLRSEFEKFSTDHPQIVVIY